MTFAYRSGSVYANSGGRTTLTIQANRLYLMPIEIRQQYIDGKWRLDPVAIRGVMCEISTAGAGSTLWMGAYSDANGLPASLRGNSASVSGATVATTGIEAILNAVLHPDVAWLALKADLGGTMPGVRALNNVDPETGTTIAPLLYQGFSMIGVADGALPATINTANLLESGGAGPRLAFKVR